MSDIQIGELNVKSIRNFVQLTPDIGTSGQPGEGEFKEIASAGYEVVINLAMPDHKDSIDSEGAIVSALGMTYIHIPVPFDSPKPEHVKTFCQYMKSIEDKKVFVHCIMNYRVSGFMYHYLNKVVGLDSDHSKSEMFSKWQPNKVWLDLLSWDSKKIGL